MNSLICIVFFTLFWLAVRRCVALAPSALTGLYCLYNSNTRFEIVIPLLSVCRLLSPNMGIYSSRLALLRSPRRTEKELSIVGDKVALAKEGFLKRSLGFLPWLGTWEMGETLIQPLNSKKCPCLLQVCCLRTGFQVSL